MKILVTGSAGFIGYSFINFICNKYKNTVVVGVDNLNSYYSTKYKKKRIISIKKKKNFIFKKIDIKNYKKLEKLFKKYKFSYVFNFAAQAGVRYSIKQPRKYIDSNINGFFNILELSKLYRVKTLFYASSSSVYGEKKNFPTKESEISSPTNVYSLSKNFNEKITQIYCNLHNIKAVGLRFFTVYGEWGRPDMYLFKIFHSMLNNKTFELNNSGMHHRDFTYIEDVNNILDKLLKKKIKEKHVIFNICSGKTVSILKVLNLIKKNKKLKVKNISRNSVDLLKTHGSNQKLIKKIGNYKFKKIEDVLIKIYEWYKRHKVFKIT